MYLFAIKISRYKWGVKKCFTFALQFFVFISDGLGHRLGGVNYLKKDMKIYRYAYLDFHNQIKITYICGEFNGKCTNCIMVLMGLCMP